MTEQNTVWRVGLQAYDLWKGGGVVMPALFATAFFLWFAIGYRWMSLRRGDPRPVAVLVENALAGRPSSRGLVDGAIAVGAELWRARGKSVPLSRLDEVFGEAEATVSSGSLVVKCLVAAAPLLGLLGTVTGLISTFGSLGSAATSTASEGIAGGIVEALYATQMGLAIAVPGLLAGGWLSRKEERLSADLELAKAMLGGAVRPAEAA